MLCKALFKTIWVTLLINQNNESITYLNPSFLRVAAFAAGALNRCRIFSLTAALVSLSANLGAAVINISANHPFLNTLPNCDQLPLEKGAEKWEGKT